MLNHAELREKFYAPLRDKFWPDFGGKEYSLYDIYMLPNCEVEEIRLITERVGKIYNKTAKLLRQAPNEVLLDLNIPQAAIPYARLKTLEQEWVIARVDLVKTPQGYKSLEINCDTPMMIKEVFHVNQLVCSAFKAKSPNERQETELVQVMREAIINTFTAMGGKGRPHVVFTSHKNHLEDRGTVQYLRELCDLDSSYCSLEDLKIDRNGLYDANEKKIDILYRQTYPIEFVVNEKDENGINIGELLMQHVIQGKLGVINPPSSFLLQSKAVQVVVWGLYENNSLFNEDERAWIKDYMLPTYLEPDIFVATGEKYVKKPAFGREGNTVEIHDGNEIFASQFKNYQSSLPVYQKHVDISTTTVNTIKGKEEKHLLLGCFLLNEKASALGIRAGGQITDENSYYLPVGTY